MLELSPGRVIRGKYRLEGMLGRGGMGTVWIAHHLQLEAPVAVKFMDAAFAASEGARRRFEREAKAAAQIRSPYVVQVHDHGVEEDVPFIVMELLDGEDLGSRLKRERRMSPAALGPIVAHVTKALQRAHEAGIVHRDLKPANVFLAKDGDDEIVKVLDFGVAKVTLSQDGEDTTTGALLGSAHYMSPEQAKGDRRIDHRSDLWSFGVILYRALTGKKPFHGSMGEAIIDICTKPIPMPSEVAPDLGPDVDRFFARALAREPAQRFQSVREMAAAFDELAASMRDVPFAAVLNASEPSESATSSSLSSDYAETELTDAATSVRDAGSGPSPASAGETSAPDVTAPPFLASVPSPPMTPSVAPTPAGPAADRSAAPFAIRRPLLWWAGGTAALIAVVGAVALARGGREPESASSQTVAPEQPANAAPASPPSASPLATEIPAAAAPEPSPAAPSGAATREPSESLSVARPIKPVKGVAPPPGKKPPARRSANDEPNFGY